MLCGECGGGEDNFGDVENLLFYLSLGISDVTAGQLCPHWPER